MYGFTKDLLLKYGQLERTPAEQAESLEQLRVLENGHKIKMIETTYTSIGIDTQEDYEKALELVDGI